MEGPANHYGKLHPQEERYHSTSSWCSIIRQGAVQCHLRETQEVRRHTTYHLCDARQGQQARDTRYDGKENKGNLIDLKSNLYAYVRQTPVSKTHARQTSARQGSVRQGSVTHSTQSFAIHKRKKKRRKMVSHGKYTQRITRGREKISMTRSTPRSDSQERQARFFART